MRPEEIKKTRIFLDSGDPQETREIFELLGFLDGQTTNPTLVAKNPIARERKANSQKFSARELLDFYKEVVGEISQTVPSGSISIEVYADKSTTEGEMFCQALEFSKWITNPHIKFPTTREGIRAATRSLEKGISVNMTLCFSQSQAAAVHEATRGVNPGQVFISPFVGRLDDRGENGLDLIKNILTMFREVQSNVEVLTASVRDMRHFTEALKMETHIITAPASVLREWALNEIKEVPTTGNLRAIPYEKIPMPQSWENFNIHHDLTENGIDRFSKDWNDLTM